MNPLASTKCAGRLIMALAAIASIFLAVGCGNGGGNITPLKGSFSNSSLSGTYVMKQTGFFENNTGASQAFSETTVFTANGSGALTVIEDDGGPQGPGTESLAGAYQINTDGTGSMTFNNQTTSTYALTMIDTNHFYVMEGDIYATSSGYGVLQTSTSMPSGAFVFKSHNFDISSRVGGVVITGNAFTGNQDLLNLGSTNLSQAITGNLAAPNANGVGTFTLTAPTGSTSGNYYVVSPSEFYFMANPTSGSLEIGQAQAQTASTLAAGTYVFGSRGDTTQNQPGVHSAGVFTTDGNGNITGGTVDYVEDGNVEDGNGSGLTVNAGAGYIMDPSGDGNGTITLPLSNGVTLSQVFWMASPTNAYFLNNSSLAVEDGTFSQQSGTVSALSSQAAFVMDGYPGSLGDQVGDFLATSSTAFNWNEQANLAGDGAAAIGTNGSYTISSNGRVEVTVNNFNPASSLVFYLSSPNTGYMVEVDGSGDIGGAFTQQTSP
jgi:hypothetical protein